MIFLNYFEVKWIGWPCRNGHRKKPRFDHALWSCHKATLEGLPKTNNYSDSFNRSFNALVGASHPNIWIFLNALKLSQSDVESQIPRYASLIDTPGKGNKKFKDRNERIKSILINQVGTTGTLDLLKNIAYNLSFS